MKAVTITPEEFVNVALIHELTQLIFQGASSNLVTRNKVMMEE